MSTPETNQPIVSLFPTHPGTLLKMEVLPERKITGAALAEAIGTPRPSITNMLNAKAPVTPLLAARIERALGYPAELLLRLQTAFDLAEVRRESSSRLETIQPIAAHG